MVKSSNSLPILEDKEGVALIYSIRSFSSSGLNSVKAICCVVVISGLRRQ
ncbi:hypothetical protein Pint_33839 [Pistacia integerrima]|uniref:Uncharacterized protein n=1 Tax=Pistacia integerrima TaxID=434235 RepID=A0ACC0X7K8_9ROSI|nr:hypothetical protein Pint_33839 [Pistacia integerrima]KAJ0077043.1 hypothetical protein Patl1_35406 [Pistacia atlantica]